MSETVQFRSNGHDASGYLVRPPSGAGPGVLVIQEWWGLDPSLKQMAARIAAAGFVALAPDLFHGEVVQHDEMDKAAHLMQTLPADRAARDMSGAVDYLSHHPAVKGQGIGVVGFCMGGLLAFVIAASRGDAVKAVVPFYGYPTADAEPDWTSLTAAIHGHMAGRDSFFPPEGARALETKLRSLGKDVTLEIHAQAAHAFMNPANALGTRDEALDARIWPQAMAFLHAQLG